MEYQKLANVYRELEKTSKKLDKTRILSEFLKKVSASEMAEVVLLLQGKVFPDSARWGLRQGLCLRQSILLLEFPSMKWKKDGKSSATWEMWLKL
ncbi:hypothetical protein HYU13_03680 [Candidatus Woesearchaeota archaeon]|nr:hypothetical protein [Candidatus Woesearchaeota archaeon]